MQLLERVKLGRSRSLEDYILSEKKATYMVRESDNCLHNQLNGVHIASSDSVFSNFKSSDHVEQRRFVNVFEKHSLNFGTLKQIFYSN